MEIRPNVLGAPRSVDVCPGALFAEVFHHQRPDTEAYRLTKNLSHDTDQANRTTREHQEFDAADNVLVVMAHARGLLGEEAGMEFFPPGTLNHGKREGVVERVVWLFLRDFTHAAENGMVQGTSWKMES